jgi:HD superfamily phosphohydrolase
MQLISSQLTWSMDLKRDSLFRCSRRINSERLIQMMNVVDDVLVIEEKGFVEKFLM